MLLLVALGGGVVVRGGGGSGVFCGVVRVGADAASDAYVGVGLGCVEAGAEGGVAGFKGLLAGSSQWLAWCAGNRDRGRTGEWTKSELKVKGKETHLRNDRIAQLRRGSALPELDQNPLHDAQRLPQHRPQPRPVGCAGRSHRHAEALLRDAGFGKEGGLEDEQVDSLVHVGVLGLEVGGQVVDAGEGGGEGALARQGLDFENGKLEQDFRVGGAEGAEGSEEVG